MAEDFNTEKELEKANAKTLIAAGLQGFGQLAGGFAKSQSAALKSVVYRRNEAALRIAADDARKQGDQDYQRVKADTAQLIGKQKAALAANGIFIGSGTAIEVITQSASIGATDALTALDNAEKQAFKLLTQAEIEKAKSKSEKRKATAELATGAAEGFSTILGGYSKVMQRRERFKRGGSE